VLNNNQIKLVQIAVRAAGIRTPKFDGRYRLLLMKYKQPGGGPVRSCQQLNNSQLDDLLAICEAQGWRQPEKPDDFYRKKVAAGDNIISFAQSEAIRYLAGDLGWTADHLNNFIRSQTNNRAFTVIELTPNEGYKIIEALKAIFNRSHGTNCNTVQQIKEEMSAGISGKEARDGTNQI
jgi:hypothetical protein